MQRDIRKWFMKPHGKGNDSESKVEESKRIMSSKRNNDDMEGKTSSGRKKTSKYFAKDDRMDEEEEEPLGRQGKRKQQSDTKTRVRTPSSKTLEETSVDSDEDVVVKAKKSKGPSVTTTKKLKSASGKSVARKPVAEDENSGDDEDVSENFGKSGGRGRGGRAGIAASASGLRGRGGRGRGGFMNFGERKDPPHKGEKEVPDGSPDCLAGLTFVISGTLDSLEREEAEDLIKRHGGRVTSSVSKKTSYLLCDEDVEGRKSTKAKELGTTFLTEDALFDMIRSSKPKKDYVDKKVKESPNKIVSPPKTTSIKAESAAGKQIKKAGTAAFSTERKPDTFNKSSSDGLTWTEKYRPKVPNDIIGNQSLVNQIHNWLKNWDEQFADSGKKDKGKKRSDPGSKKALLLSGSPGIGKTTSAKLVSQMLGFLTIEVNASDSRGKADGKIFKGIGGSNANCIKELVSNQNIATDSDRSRHPKTVLIMDEVDGMSAGDRGGIADLINSIKISKIPIICICNDRYSQKLKSLVNYCMVLSFRKPTKQQMAKRLMQVSNAEGLKINEIALEELAERANGDMRMALNQLQYMSLSMSVIKYDDVRQRLLSSAKDEDISPFTAVDKMFGFNGGKLKMDERIDLSMSDMDLVPLIVQENYLNYRPNSVGKDDNGIARMRLISRAAESIADGDIINVQIRRHRQWQLSQNAAVASCIIPSALLHGQREILEQGERNFNRFGGWLGKNSTTGKNMRLLEDLHYHLLASRETNIGRETIRLDYLTLFLKRLTDPLRLLPKDEAVAAVVKFMNVYSISQEDVDTIVTVSKFQGRANPLDGVPSAVKAALTRAYKEDIGSRMVRAADLIVLPGLRKPPKRRVAAMLEVSEDALEQGGGEAPSESDEDESSDADINEEETKATKLQSEIQSLNSNGIEVELELHGTRTAKAKGRGRGGAASATKKQAGRGRGGGGRGKAAAENEDDDFVEKVGPKRKR